MIRSVRVWRAKSGGGFTICLCVGPEFDGYRAQKMKHLPRKTHNRSQIQSRRAAGASKHRLHDMFEDYTS
jgi:hypothetical protein